MLAGADLVKARQRITSSDKSLPLKGQKEFQPNGSWLETKQIQSALDERKALLDIPRVEKQQRLSTAEWHQDLGLGLVVRRVGNDWETFGYESECKLWIYPEEALFLLETNRIELLLDDVPVSIEQGYAVLLGPSSSCSLEQYRTFSHLKRNGYVVRKHCPELTVTRYEHQLRLDQYAAKSCFKAPKAVDLTERRTSQGELEIKEQDVIRVEEIPEMLMEEDEPLPKEIDTEGKGVDAEQRESERDTSESVDNHAVNESPSDSNSLCVPRSEVRPNQSDSQKELEIREYMDISRDTSIDSDGKETGNGSTEDEPKTTIESRGEISPDRDGLRIEAELDSTTGLDADIASLDGKMTESSPVPSNVTGIATPDDETSRNSGSVTTSSDPATSNNELNVESVKNVGPLSTGSLVQEAKQPEQRLPDSKEAAPTLDVAAGRSENPKESGEVTSVPVKVTSVPVKAPSGENSFAKEMNTWRSEAVDEDALFDDVLEDLVDADSPPGVGAEERGGSEDEDGSPGQQVLEHIVETMNADNYEVKQFVSEDAGGGQTSAEFLRSPADLVADIDCFEVDPKSNDEFVDYSSLRVNPRLINANDPLAKVEPRNKESDPEVAVDSLEPDDDEKPFNKYGNKRSAVPGDSAERRRKKLKPNGPEEAEIVEFNDCDIAGPVVDLDLEDMEVSEPDFTEPRGIDSCDFLESLDIESKGESLVKEETNDVDSGKIPTGEDTPAAESDVKEEVSGTETTETAKQEVIKVETIGIADQKEASRMETMETAYKEEESTVEPTEIADQESRMETANRDEFSMVKTTEMANGEVSTVKTRVSDKEEGSILETVETANKQVETMETANKEVSREETMDTENKEVSREETMDTENKEVSREETMETANKEGSRVETMETANKEVSREETMDTENKEIRREETMDTANKEVSREETMKTANKEVSREETMDTENEEVSREETMKTANKEVSREETMITANKEVSREETMDSENNEIRREETMDSANKEVSTEETVKTANKEVETMETQNKAESSRAVTTETDREEVGEPGDDSVADSTPEVIDLLSSSANTSLSVEVLSSTDALVQSVELSDDDDGSEEDDDQSVICLSDDDQLNTTVTLDDEEESEEEESEEEEDSDCMEVEVEEGGEGRKRRREDEESGPAPKRRVVETVDLSDEEVEIVEAPLLPTPLPRPPSSWNASLLEDAERTRILSTIVDVANKFCVKVGVPPECERFLPAGVRPIKRENVLSLSALGTVGLGGKPHRGYRPAYEVVRENGGGGIPDRFCVDMLSAGYPMQMVPAVWAQLSVGERAQYLDTCDGPLYAPDHPRFRPHEDPLGPPPLPPPRPRFPRRSLCGVMPVQKPMPRPGQNPGSWFQANNWHGGPNARQDVDYVPPVKVKRESKQGILVPAYHRNGVKQEDVKPKVKTEVKAETAGRSDIRSRLDEAARSFLSHAGTQRVHTQVHNGETVYLSSNPDEVALMLTVVGTTLLRERLGLELQHVSKNRRKKQYPLARTYLALLLEKLKGDPSHVPRGWGVKREPDSEPIQTPLCRMDVVTGGHIGARPPPRPLDNTLQPGSQQAAPTLDRSPQPPVALMPSELPVTPTTTQPPVALVSVTSQPSVLLAPTQPPVALVPSELPFTLALNEPPVTPAPTQPPVALEPSEPPVALVPTPLPDRTDETTDSACEVSQTGLSRLSPAGDETREKGEEGRDVEPLLRPADCTTIDNVLSRLAIIRPAHLQASCKRKLSLHYDLYLPKTVFRKAAPCLPNFRVVVLRGDDPMPEPGEMANLLQRYQDKVHVLYAVVQPDSVNFYLLEQVQLPAIPFDLACLRS